MRAGEQSEREGDDLMSVADRERKGPSERVRSDRTDRSE